MLLEHSGQTSWKKGELVSAPSGEFPPVWNAKYEEPICWMSFVLKKGGYGLLSVKSRSIDVTKKPKDIFRQVHAQLDSSLKVVDSRDLGPFEKDHMMFFCKA